jgi:hypothetical protein
MEGGGRCRGGSSGGGAMSVDDVEAAQVEEEQCFLPL